MRTSRAFIGYFAAAPPVSGKPPLGRLFGNSSDSPAHDVLSFHGRSRVEVSGCVDPAAAGRGGETGHPRDKGSRSRKWCQD